MSQKLLQLGEYRSQSRPTRSHIDGLTQYCSHRYCRKLRALRLCWMH